MKKITTSIILLCLAFIVNAQTATNFTATDCKGNTHTLFTELDNGKIIVMVSVMPCSMCISGGDAAYLAVQSFAVSNPGKVLYYLVDDIGDNSCSDLVTFAVTNSIDTSKITIFGNAGNVINMFPYGGAAMPRILVVGGSSHHVFFNQHDGAANDQSGIQTAITNAINKVGINTITNQISFSVFPNPITNQLSVNYDKGIDKISITSITGKVIKEIACNGKANPSINMSGIAGGLYLISVTDMDRNKGIQKIIKE